jgi:hypothetical protein
MLIILRPRLQGEQEPLPSRLPRLSRPRHPRASINDGGTKNLPLVYNSAMRFQSIRNLVEREQSERNESAIVTPIA